MYWGSEQDSLSVADQPASLVLPLTDLAEMNPVNSTALYVSACRSLLQCDPKDPKTYGGLFNVLPFFRDSLSCLVCGK